jgi:hypothetical protein
MNRFLAEIRINLRRALRLRGIGRVSQGGPSVRAPVLAFVLGASLAMKAARDFAAAGSDPAFDEWGLVTFFAGWAVLALAITLLGGRRAEFSLSRAIADLAGIMLVNALLLLIMTICWRTFAQKPVLGGVPVQYIWYGAYGLIGIWSFVTIWRAGNRLWTKPVRFPGARLVFAALIPAMLIPRQGLIYGSDTDWTRVDLWYQVREALYVEEKQETVESSLPAIDYEATLYRQAAMVGKAIAGLKPPSGEASQFYFLGLAPSSAQTVFKSEVLGAKAAFETRLGAKGHSIVMINSNDTLAEFPLASMSNLDLALAGIAKVMRPDKDVLALFVTSHGSAGLISVSLPGFPLNGITPEALAQTLEKSGIKNRVIIISACYSGSFIPALASENTLVMTAASAAKTSFGCSNERDWTYFGDALFNHALKATDSFPRAFAIARDLIKTWETEQKLTPSEPQISMGKTIAKALDSMTHEESGTRVLSKN